MCRRFESFFDGSRDLLDEGFGGGRRVLREAENRAATEVRGGNFFVRANNDLFQASKGNWD